MKLLADFLPIVIFFIAYKLFGIYYATGIAILVAALQCTIFWIKNKRVEMMHVLSLSIIGILGGATLIFHNDVFIKWKPTAINWVLALVFLISQFTPRSLIQRMMDHNVNLPQQVWLKINLSWVIFFTLLGIINLYVAYHFSTDIWVNFKLFGMLGATIAFVIIQSIYLTKQMHLKEEQDKANNV